MLRIRDLSLAPGAPEGDLYEAAAKALGSRVTSLTVVRRSVDARRKNDIRIIYTVDAAVSDEASALARCAKASPAPHDTYTPPAASRQPVHRPVVVGFGPAGMFAGLLLALAGLRPVILERGEASEDRAKKIRRLRKHGILDPESNIQFGEGGAGAFSDGKLTTGVKDPRLPWILQTLHEAGAPADILIDAKPHIGTDLLPGVCTALRKRILTLGGEVRFSHKLIGLEHSGGRITAAVTESGRFPCSRLILACGHSARDTFEMLCRLDVPMAPKAFAMGVRIEHLRKDIDRAQYGAFAGHPALPAADYSLACQTSGGRRCYTFCMCPGGEVMPAASEAGGVCVNGASPWKRDLVNSNAALLTAVEPADFPEKDLLGGMRWQRALERRAFELGGGGYRAPVQQAGAFLGIGVSGPRVAPSYLPGVAETDLHALLPPVIAAPIAEALGVFGRRLRGFDAPGAVLTGPETRSSSPVRILRGPTLESVGLQGLYPCGEGAGWAGGIMSAAADGMRCAEALIRAVSAG